MLTQRYEVFIPHAGHTALMWQYTSPKLLSQPNADLTHYMPKLLPSPTTHLMLKWIFHRASTQGPSTAQAGRPDQPLGSSLCHTHLLPDQSQLSWCAVLFQLAAMQRGIRWRDMEKMTKCWVA